MDKIDEKFIKSTAKYFPNLKEEDIIDQLMYVYKLGRASVYHDMTEEARNREQAELKRIREEKK